MRKFAILGASALVLTLGAAQAFASPQRPETYGYFTQNPYFGQPAAAQNHVGLNDFRAEEPDATWQAPSQINPLLAHRGR
jgi:hypothetical protein